MQVEIWSDIMCPFCYIGKRNFEQAVNQMEDKGEVNVLWRSFLLQPDLKPVPGKDIYDLLSEIKGVNRDRATLMNQQVSEIAKKAGLHYDFDKVIVANSFDAHRLSHLALEHGLQNEAEEKLFAAYFTDGRDIGDLGTLKSIGEEIGLKAQAVEEMLSSGAFAGAVKADVREARELGITGVPFFIFNRKYAVSGAQPVSTFAEALKKVLEEEKGPEVG